MSNLASFWQRLRLVWNEQGRTVKLSITLVAAGYVLGWLIAPDKTTASSVLWLELALPLLLASLLLVLSPKGREYLAVFLAIFFLVVALSDIAGRELSLNKVKNQAVVSTALFEIYPISGLGLGGYSYHYQQNAPKIISQPLDVPMEPRLSVYSLWASGGLLALAGVVLLIVELYRRHRLASWAGVTTALLLIMGPAASYPFRAVFFIVFWMIVALALVKETDV